jgi:hypothetical protein
MCAVIHIFRTCQRGTGLRPVPAHSAEPPGLAAASELWRLKAGLCGVGSCPGCAPEHHCVASHCRARLLSREVSRRQR